jgi:transcriptional regulator with XRE-family HTH domain
VKNRRFAALANLDGTRAPRTSCDHHTDRFDLRLPASASQIAVDATDPLATNEHPSRPNIRPAFLEPQFEIDLDRREFVSDVLGEVQPAHGVQWPLSSPERPRISRARERSLLCCIVKIVRGRRPKPVDLHRAPRPVRETLRRIRAHEANLPLEDSGDVTAVEAAPLGELSSRQFRHLRRKPGLQGDYAPGQCARVPHDRTIVGESARVNRPGSEISLNEMGRPPTIAGVDDIGERFKALRTALGLSTEEVSKRTRPEGQEKPLLDRRRVERVEKGQAKLTSINQREGLSRAYGLTRQQIDAFIRGSLDVATAIELARAKMAELPFPVSSSNDPARITEDLGGDMGTALILRDTDKLRFPNLEVCLEYHRRNGKVWDRGVVWAAHGGHFGERDLPKPSDWEAALDRLQAVMRHVTVHGTEPTHPKLLK